MAEKNLPFVKIFTPKTLLQLAQNINKNPGSYIFDGYISPSENHNDSTYKFSNHVINLSEINEFNSITRSDRFIDVGRTVTINQFLKNGDRLIHPEVYSQFRAIGPDPMRNVITIGTLFFHLNERPIIKLLLNILDPDLEIIQVKVRRGKRISFSSRRIPFSRLIDEYGSAVISKDEILNRVRIPTDGGEYIFFRTINCGTRKLYLLILTSTNRNQIVDFRLAATSSDNKYFRKRELEAHLIGRKTHSLNKQFENYKNELCDSFSDPDMVYPIENALSHIFNNLHLDLIEKGLNKDDFSV